MLKARSITADLVKATIADCLTTHVGPGRRWSDAEAARMADTSESSIKNWRGGVSSPEPHNLVKLFTVPEMGPDLANQYLGLAGFASHPLEAQTICHFRLSRLIADSSSILTRALEDQRVDHREQAEIDASLRMMLPVIEQYLNRKESS